MDDGRGRRVWGDGCGATGVARRVWENSKLITLPASPPRPLSPLRGGPPFPISPNPNASPPKSRSLGRLAFEWGPVAPHLPLSPSPPLPLSPSPLP
ncbi:MAG: hypothetical protein ACHBN1_15385 [Heteroscytonema crispum UTEX LB 1556]